MSENCPKCGANRTQFEGQTSWVCGSYSMYVPGLNPFWAHSESEHCKCRQQLAALTQRAEQATADLRTVHAHVKEALELLGVDVSIDGYIPDSWTLREQCHLAKGRLERAEQQVTDLLYDQYYGLCEKHLQAKEVAEAEVKRLRDGIREKGEEFRTGTFCRMCEHMQDMCDCKEISAEYDALLAQPSDGKEAEGGK